MNELKPKTTAGRRIPVYAYNFITGKKLWGDSIAYFCRQTGATPSVIRRLLLSNHPFMCNGWIFSYGTPTIIKGINTAGSAGWKRLVKQWHIHYPKTYK